MGILIMSHDMLQNRNSLAVFTENSMKINETTKLCKLMTFDVGWGIYFPFQLVIRCYHFVKCYIKAEIQYVLSVKVLAWMAMNEMKKTTKMTFHVLNFSGLIKFLLVSWWTHFRNF
jgi:hypothetical protein